MDMVNNTMIITRNSMEEIYRQVKEAYPNECCGILLGRTKDVDEIKAVENINKDRLRDRYEMSPRGIYEIDKYARAKGFGIIGFYHSHPDHPAYPSAFDKEMAVDGYIYLIVSISLEDTLKARAWLFEKKCDHFLELKITVVKKNGH